MRRKRTSRQGLAPASQLCAWVTWHEARGGASPSPRAGLAPVHGVNGVAAGVKGEGDTCVMATECADSERTRAH